MSEELKLYCGCHEVETTAVWFFDGPDGQPHIAHMLCRHPIADPPTARYWRPSYYLACACGEVFSPEKHMRACPVYLVWKTETVRMRLDEANALPAPEDSFPLTITVDTGKFMESARECIKNMTTDEYIAAMEAARERGLRRMREQIKRAIFNC